MFGSFKPHFAADFERLVCTERNQITSLATELCAKDGNEIDRAPVTMIMPAKNTFLNIAHPFDVIRSQISQPNAALIQFDPMQCSDAVTIPMDTQVVISLWYDRHEL